MIELPDDPGIRINRVSDYSSAALCGGRVRLRTHEHYDPAPSTTLLKGSVMHSFIELELAGTSVSKRDFKQVAAKMFREVYARDTKGDELLLVKAEFLDWIEEIELGVKAWRKKIKPIFAKKGELLVEQTFYAPIPESDNKVWLQGTPDVVDFDDGRIHDWKTASKPWSQAKADSELQAAAYPWLVDENLARLVDEFVFWIYVWEDQEWQQLPTQVPISRVEAFEELMVLSDPTSAGFRPQSGLFNSPRGWWCQPKFCNAWAACPIKGVIIDGKEDLPALTREEKLA